MPEGQVDTRKGSGICDICGRWMHCTVQTIDGVTVAMQCRKCQRMVDDDES